MKHGGGDQNTWALNKAGAFIHASLVPSGRGDYYCGGCKQPMQAVHRHIPYDTSFFRHDVLKNGTNPNPCTYADETIRHRIAKDILQRLKMIKVPKVLKFPPQGVEGNAMLLQRERFISCTTVRNEVAVHINEYGELQWVQGRPSGIADQLIIADVAFFDKDDALLLLVELEATHKVPESKKIKLRTLGIDTVEVLLPTGPPDEIEEAFKTTGQTKWLYNGLEFNTTYTTPAEGRGAAVHEVDGDQRTLLRESIECRKALLGNLMRRLERYMGTSDFQKAANDLQAAIGGLGIARGEAREQWRKREIALRAEVEDRYRPVQAEVATSDREANERATALAKQRSGLESRYHSKRRELAEKERELEERLRQLQHGSEDSPGALEQQAEGIDRAIAALRNLEAELRDKEVRVAAEFERATSAAQKHFDTERERLDAEESRLAREEAGLPGWIASQELEWKRRQERALEAERRSIAGIEQDTRNERDSISERQESLAREFDELREQLHRTALEGTGGQGYDAARTVKEVLALGAKVADLAEGEARGKRLREALRSLRSGTYEAWYRQE
jgi:hypothetical protein